MKNSSTLLLFSYVITTHEFAEILTRHNPDIEDINFFIELILQAVDARVLYPLPIPHRMGDPKFQPIILFKWAKQLGFNLPSECIELIKKANNHDENNCLSSDAPANKIAEVATQNHVSQTEITSLQPATPASDPDLLKEHQKKIGFNGGRKPKAKEALALLAASELRHERGFADFMKMLKEHSSTEPYDGIDECSVIYLDGNSMCYTENKNNKSIKTSIAVASMRRYFTNAKKNK